MSFAEYCSELPNLFLPDAATASSSPDDQSVTSKSGQDSHLPQNQGEEESPHVHYSNNQAPITPSTTRRSGFLDIVEYHVEYGYPDNRPAYFLTDEFLSITEGLTVKPTIVSRGERKWQFGESAIILRRTHDRRWDESNHSRYSQWPVHLRDELEIHSEPLCVRFREIAAKSYEGTNLQSYPIKLKRPFFELFFYRAEISALAGDENIDPDLRRDAQALDEFVRQPNGPVASIAEAHDQFRKEGKVVSDILWTVYPPNSLLVYNDGHVKECYICRDVRLESTGATDKKKWLVTGLRIGFDGISPVLARQEFVLNSPGTKILEIGQIPLCPVQEYRDWGGLRLCLQNRFRKIINDLGTDLSSFACRHYRGSAWYGYDTNMGRERSPSLHINERVVLDIKQFPYKRRHFHPSTFEDLNTEDSSHSPIRVEVHRGAGTGSAKANLTRDTISKATIEGWWTISIPDETKMTQKLDLGTIEGLAQASMNKFQITQEEFELIFPALVPAFGLATKQWVWVLSDQLLDVQWDKAAFNSLQHNPMTKSLIQTLVQGHKTSSSINGSQDDRSRKRTGLTFLLHGRPGLGKGFTAEGISEIAERPLCSISGEELCDKVETARWRLFDFFIRAKRWNAVALVTEADAPFGMMNSADSKPGRPAAAKAFLTLLESFRGILFLTAANQTSFDDDFLSHIDLTIGYREPSSQALSEIWKYLVKNDNRVDTDLSWNEDVYHELGKLVSNGRSIQRTLRTAVAFAKAEKKPLGAYHVLAVLGTELRAENFGNDEGKWETQVQPALLKLHEILNIPSQET